MQIITFANSKGGTGKSTAIRAVASAFEKLGKSVVIADLDSQQTIGGWFEINTDGIYPIPSEDALRVVPMYFTMDDETNAERVQTELTKLADSRAYDFLLIDTKGVASVTNSIAIGSADLVVCPTNGDADEFEPIVNTFKNYVEICEKVAPDEDPKDRFWVMFTKNQAMHSSEALAMRAALKEHFKIFEGLPMVSAFNSRASYGATLSGMIEGWEDQRKGDRTRRVKATREIEKYKKALDVSVKLADDIVRAMP